MIREILGIALVVVGSISLIAHIVATGQRAAASQAIDRRASMKRR